MSGEKRVRLWVKHWLIIRSRKFGSFREETPLALISVEKASLGERDLPVEPELRLRHWMSNLFIYLMPEGAEQEDSVHGWEVKIGLTLEAAQELVEGLTKTIQECLRRKEERRKQREKEEEETWVGN